MKRLSKLILTMLSFCLFICSIEAKEVSYVDYKVKAVYINSSLDFIGSMHVTEAIVVEGSLNGFEREINFKNGKLKEWEEGQIDFANSSFYNGRGVSISKVSSFAIEEEEIDWEILGKSYTAYELGEKAKEGDTGVYTSEKTDNGNIVRIYNPNNSGYAVYIFDYYINQIAVLHNDVAEVYWTFLPQEFDDVESVNIQFTLPGTSTSDTFRFWAHGSLNGEIAGVSETKDEDGNNLYKGVIAKVKNVKSGSGVDIRLTFDKSLVSFAEQFLNQSKMDALNEIIKVETERANSANSQRVLVKIIFYSTIVLSGLYFVGLVILWIYIYKKYDKEYRVRFSAKYYREFTGKYDVEIVDYLMKKDITIDAFTASIMNLIYKKNIKIEDMSEKKKNLVLKLDNRKKLSDAEKLVVELLFDEIGKGDTVTLKAIEKYSKKEETARLFMNKYDTWKNLVKEIAEKEEFFESKKNPKVLGGAYFGMGILLCILMIIFNPSAYLIIMFIAISSLIFFIYCLSFKKWTQKGRDHYLKWSAFKNFLNDFGTFETKELPEIKLWEKYLVYATVFGIAKRVQKNMKIHLTNLADDTVITTYPMLYRDIYIGNSINNSIASAYTSSIASINAANANSSMSSGSGFGGGFSSGGGFAGGGGSGSGF